MDSVRNTVYYCCVARGNRILYAYSSGGEDHEVENLASLCLESTPSFHKWYFETIGKRTFGFLIEDVYVYFIIVDENIGNFGVLRFLEDLRDEFKKVSRKGSRGTLSNANSISVQEHLLPVIHRLIASLQSVSQASSSAWTSETLSFHTGLSASPGSSANGQIEVFSSTKAPLLGKSSKQEKKAKDHVIGMRDVELEERRKSTDRGVDIDSISATLDSSNQAGAGSSMPLQKELGSMRMRSATQTIRKKWWRQVRIVLAIDAAVCLVLFVIWLFICHGIKCIG